MEEYRKITRIEKYLAVIIGEEAELPEAPIYREEFYLAKIAGETVELPPPITRIDYYLAKIAGEDVELPTPISRIDYLLAKVAGEDVETPEYPLSEAEKYLLKWAEGGGYEETTVEGVSPLLLAAALEKEITALIQSGKVEQDGTPTPVAPVPIVCNNGELKYGVLGKNWFDIATVGIEQGSIASSNGGNSVSTYRVRTAGYVPVLPSTQYTISAVIDGYTSGGSRGVFVLEYASNAVAGYTGNSSGWNTPTGYTFTTGATTTYIRIVFAKGSSSSTPTVPADVTNVQLELGDTATPYEPYKGVGLYVDGTPEVISVIQNQNTDPTIVKYTLASGETEVRYSSTSATIVAPVKPNTTYTIGFLTAPIGGSIFRVATTKDKATSTTSASTIAYDLNFNNYANKTLNSGNEANWMYVQLSNTQTDDFPNIIIQEGTNLTPPQTASAVNLYSAGSYKDTQDIISGTVTRKCGVLVLDGSESWVSRTVGGVYRFQTEITDVIQTATYNFFVTHGKTASSGGADYWSIRNGGLLCFAPSDTTMLASEFTTWLAAQYAAGTPVIVIYPLAEPTTEQTDPQTLATLDGDNVITVTANVNNIQIEATYAKKKGA